jgi:hypothetical protein
MVWENGCRYLAGWAFVHDEKHNNELPKHSGFRKLG